MASRQHSMTPSKREWRNWCQLLHQPYWQRIVIYYRRTSSCSAKAQQQYVRYGLHQLNRHWEWCQNMQRVHSSEAVTHIFNPYSIGHISSHEKSGVDAHVNCLQLRIPLIKPHKPPNRQTMHSHRLSSIIYKWYAAAGEAHIQYYACSAQLTPIR